MRRHEFLQTLHLLTRPRTYLETGIQKGQSLHLSRVPSVGIDPEFSIVAEVLADVHLARTTSDEFFARKNPLAHLPVNVIDLAFVDGMHLAEYALRDYLAVERFTTPASVIVFDDMLPRSIDEAARYRHTSAWTGDVYKAVQALRDLRPDLIVLEVNTQPTGLGVVLVPTPAVTGCYRATTTGWRSRSRRIPKTYRRPSSPGHARSIRTGCWQAPDGPNCPGCASRAGRSTGRLCARCSPTS